MKLEPVLLAVVIALCSCAAALHAVRTIVDVADDLCMLSLSDPKLEPETAKIMGGSTAREACNDAAIARTFIDQAKSGQRRALGSLRGGREEP